MLNLLDSADLHLDQISRVSQLFQVDQLRRVNWVDVKGGGSTVPLQQAHSASLIRSYIEVQL